MSNYSYGYPYYPPVGQEFLGPSQTDLAAALLRRHEEIQRARDEQDRSRGVPLAPRLPPSHVDLADLALQAAIELYRVGELSGPQTVARVQQMLRQVRR